MLSMRIDTMVAALVRQELIEKGGNEKALHFHFDLRMGHYTNDKSLRQSRGLHLLYHLKPGHAYVSVFSAVMSSPFDKIDRVYDWKYETCHDSEWRSIRIFADIYFQMAQQINQKLVAEGMPEVAPITMSEHNSCPLFGQMYDWVPVEISKDPTDPSNYRRTIKVVR